MRILALVFLIGVNAFAGSSKVSEECTTREEFNVQDKSAEQEAWFQWVAEQKVQDSVGFFKNLVSNPNYENFGLGRMQMSHSRSAQKPATSPEHPRLITYDRELGIFLGLVDTPNPKYESYNRNFEGIRYNFIKDTWEPFKGFFTEEGVEIKSAPADVVTCTGSHGSNFRPIWRSYDAWPGQVSNFAADLRGDRLGKVAYSSHGRPGQMLMFYLNKFNYVRIKKSLEQNPNWKQYRPAAIASLLGCEDIDQFFGAKTRSKMGGHNRLKALRAEVEATIESNTQFEIDFANRIGDDPNISSYNELQDAGRMASLRYLFEASGTDVKAFGLSRPPGRNAVGYGFNQVGTEDGGVQNLLCQILPNYLEEGGTSQEVFNWEPYSLNKVDIEKACAELKIESLRLNPEIVEFKIPKGQNGKPWNTRATPIRAKIGETIRIINQDDVSHRLHTFGAPCDHGKEIRPGQSWDCVADSPYNSLDPKEGPLWDHEFGDTARVWIVVK